MTATSLSWLNSTVTGAFATAIVVSPAMLAVSVDIDYTSLASEIESGTLRHRLEEELTNGFRDLRSQGEPLPPASYFATRVAEIINSSATEPLNDALKYGLYLEVLTACEHARATVLGEPPPLQ